MPRPATRRAYLLRIVIRPLVLFGGWSVVVLALLGALDPSGLVPPELVPARAEMVAWVGDGLSLPTLGWAMAAGVLIGALIARVLARRGWDGAFGDTSAVMPRSVRELPWGAVMALAAGVSEELFFRLALPLLTARVTGSAWAGLALGTILFALAHAYQNWRGVIATGVVGALLAAAFLVSNSLWTVIALHIALDLNALVLRPVLAGRVRLRSSAATRS